MLSSRLAGVDIFCFNLHSPFLSIVLIFTFQAILFQILLSLFQMHSSHDFLDQPFFLFQVISGSITSRICYLMSRRMASLCHHRRLCFIIFDLHNNTHPIPKNISQHFIDQSHATYLPYHTTLHVTQPCLIRNCKFRRFT